MASRRILIGAAGLLALGALLTTAVLVVVGGSGADGGEPASAVTDGLPGATSEGVGVHGHWTIEVREPDGALVRHVEFDNAFIGAAALVKFLARSNSVGLWTVSFLVEQGPGLGSPNHFVREPSSTGTCTATCSKTLTVSAVDDKLVLSGSGPSTVSGTITTVDTTVIPCAATKSAASPCTSGTVQYITSAQGLSIPVTSGQSVQVTVEITLS